jgi:uncharacterized membrane protein SirB2
MLRIFCNTYFPPFSGGQYLPENFYSLFIYIIIERHIIANIFAAKNTAARCFYCFSAAVYGIILAAAYAKAKNGGGVVGQAYI